MIEGKKVVQLVTEAGRANIKLTREKKKQYDELKKVITKQCMSKWKWDDYKKKPDEKLLRDVLKDVIEAD